MFKYKVTFLSIFLTVFTASSVFSEDNSTDLDLLKDVLEKVKTEYVREVPTEELIEAAIRGVLQDLDPHSGYLDPNFYAQLRNNTKGEFGGLGIEVTYKDGDLIVVSPTEGSPAALAGINPGDIIKKIDGVIVRNLSLMEAVKLLRGEKGTAVKLTLAKKGSNEITDNVNVVRDVITLHSVSRRLLSKGIGVLRINQFVEKTAGEVQDAMSGLVYDNGGPLSGLVVDLRNNPGGLLMQAVKIGDIFLKDGVIVSIKGRDPAESQEFFARNDGQEPEYPIVTIINNGSASASEIIAGALRDHGRSITVGTTSFGKGSVQTITPLRNHGALSLTTALYYTKSGRSIQLTGVVPDVEVDSQDDEYLAPASKPKRREEDLPNAIQNPTEGVLGKEEALQPVAEAIVKQKPSLEKDPELLLLARDLQLEKAVEILSSFPSA